MQSRLRRPQRKYHRNGRASKSELQLLISSYRHHHKMPQQRRNLKCISCWHDRELSITLGLAEERNLFKRDPAGQSGSSFEYLEEILKPVY